MSISNKTRREFQQSYSSYSILCNIEYDFEDAGITATDLPESELPSGARRSLVEQYYRSVNWSSEASIRKVLGAFESHLLRLEDDGHKDEFEKLTRLLRRDGYRYEDGRILLPESIPGTSETTSVEVGHLWLPDHFRLFLSHVSSFKQKASLLQQELLKYQVTSFVSHLSN